MSTQPTTGSTGSNQLLKSFISGGIGGVCLCLAGHPFDLIKTRYQAAAPGQYSGGVLDVVKATFREGGVRGLYRGISAPLMGVTPIFAVCMWAYGVGKDVMRGVTGAKSDSELSLLSLGCAGALSAIPTTAIMAPGERIKVMLVVPRAPGEAPFKGAGDVVRHLVKTEGVASLFRGATATLLRDGVGSFAYFAAYEAIKRSEKNGGAPASPLTIIMGGAAAGMANWIVALPFDVVKSRIQSSSALGKPMGVYGVTRELIIREGIAGLYRGITPALIRAVPANAAFFTGQENSKRWLDTLF